MLKQYCQIDKRNRKATIADFFSILAFAFILIVFYFLLKLTLRASFELPTQSKNLQDTISLLGILRTPVVVDNIKINIAELIAISNLDSTKKSLIENKLVQIMDDTFGISLCSVICIDGQEIKGSGCANAQNYICPREVALIPSYGGKPIEVSFESNLEAVNIQYI